MVIIKDQKSAFFLVAWYLHAQLEVSLDNAVLQPHLQQLQLLVSLLQVGFGDQNLFSKRTFSVGNVVAWMEAKRESGPIREQNLAGRS